MIVGLTLSYLLDLLRRRKAESVKIVTLLDKPHHRKVDIKPDYCGFVVPDEFVVGYGLDYAERYRNFPYIGILKPRSISKLGLAISQAVLLWTKSYIW